MIYYIYRYNQSFTCLQTTWIRYKHVQNNFPVQRHFGECDREDFEKEI